MSEASAGIILGSVAAPARPAASLVGLSGRLGACVLALGCGVVLGLASWLHPAAEGAGTHEQLGLAPCPWLVLLGCPCPTCGMTTAFAHAAHGHLGAAFEVQPFGALLALAVAPVMWGALHVAVTGSNLGSLAVRAMRPRVLWGLLALWAASWVYKMWAMSR